MIFDSPQGGDVEVRGQLQAPYYDTSRDSHGMVRCIGGRLQVYDGSGWLDLRTSLYATLSPLVKETLDWAQKKMRQEAELEQLMNKHPGLRDSKERFEIMLALVRKDNKEGNDHGVTTGP